MSQTRLDDLDLQLRGVFQQDPRLRHALAYGSRTQDRPGALQADEYSDLEYYLYPHPGLTVDPRELVLRATPVLLSVINPFGTPNFVTPELHRIELHVQDAGQLEALLGWPVLGPDPARMLVKDEDGALEALLRRFAAQPEWQPEPAQRTYDRVLNTLVAVRGFLARGERLRAFEWHSSQVVGGLIRLARHAEGTLQPPAPAHWAERELSAGMTGELTGLAASASDLELGYAAALRLGETLAQRLGLDLHPELLQALLQVP